MHPYFDAAAVRQALSSLLDAGQVFELRILGARRNADARPGIWSGYFDDVDAAVQSLGVLRGGFEGAYWTPNPIDPDLLARRRNRLDYAQRGETTADANVTRRRWLLVDVDPVRPKGISSTDVQHTAALQLAQRVAADLGAAGVPVAVQASSGNGAHLLIRVDLPCDSDLPKRMLQALAARFDDGACKIDQSVFNPARIWKLYGTRACKGDATPDRPHRLAQVVDLVAQPAVVDAQALQQVVDAWAPAAAPLPLATRPALRVVGATVDALSLVRRAGLDPDDGHAHPAGGVVHPLGVCPCGRRESDRASFLALPASGAVGLGCRHDTCEFSASAGSPGDHWKRWRAQNDPDAYTAPPVDVAAVTARATSWASSLGAAADDGLDLDGFTDGAAAAASAVVQAPRPTGQTTADGRRQINVTADLRDLRDDVLDAFTKSPTIYVSGDSLARVDGDARMQPLLGGALDSACVDLCEFVVHKQAQSGAWEARPAPLPPRVLGMLENLSPSQQAQFRIVDQITRSPFVSPSGAVVTRPGYDRAARTLLVDCPDVTRRWPDGASALAYLRDMLADFPFESEAEASNYLGALVSVVARPLIDGPMPMLLLEANTPGVGKSLLAQLVQVVFGLPAEIGPLPRDEKALAQLLLSILLEAKAVHVFDNVKHAILSASLDMVLTSTTYTDRILGKSKSISCPVRQLWICTVNNGRLSPDMVRRVVRCRLRWDGPGKPEERRDVQRPDLLAWAKANRSAILSALVQLVADWLAAGQPVDVDAPRLGSFESWSRVVGGVMRHAGDRDWLGNLRAAKEATSIDDDWEAFFAAWIAELPLTAKAGQLLGLSQRHALLGDLVGPGDDVGKASRLGRALSQRRDSIWNGWRLVVSKDERTRQSVYSLERVAEADLLPRKMFR